MPCRTFFREVCWDPIPDTQWSWSIYLHLVSFGGFHVGKYIIHPETWGRWSNPILTSTFLRTNECSGLKTHQLFTIPQSFFHQKIQIQKIILAPNPSGEVRRFYVSFFWEESICSFVWPTPSKSIIDIRNSHIWKEVHCSKPSFLVSILTWICLRCCFILFYFVPWDSSSSNHYLGE